MRRSLRRRTRGSACARPRGRSPKSSPSARTTSSLYQEVHSLERGLRRKLLARTHEFFEDVGRIVEQAAAEGVILTPNAYFATQVITFLPAMLALRRWDIRNYCQTNDVIEWIVDFVMRGLDDRTVARRASPRRVRSRATKVARGRGAS
jgi:hypothetical protein